MHSANNRRHLTLDSIFLGEFLENIPSCPGGRLSDADGRLAYRGDPRKGFERFEPLIETLLSLALSFFVVFYLTRLDNEFVLSDSQSFGEFIKSDLWYGFINGIAGLFKGKNDFFIPQKA